MEYVILGVAANVLRAYTVYRFMELIYLPKNNEKIKLVLYALFVIITSGGYYFFYNFYINVITNLLGLFLITTRYQGNLWKHVLSVCGIYSINIIVEFLIFLTVNSGRNTNLMNSFYECLTSITIFFIVIILEKIKFIKDEKYQFGFSKWVALISIPIMSIGIILVLLERYISYKDTTEIEIIGILIINMVVFYLYGAVQDYYKQKIQREEFLNRMKVYNNQILVMKKSYEKIRETKHDMKHHLIELKYWANQGNKEELLKYIESIEKYMHNTDEYASSGNKEIDGTLNYLLRNANLVIEDLNVNILIPENLQLHNYMFNVILGNLLDNAIEASKKSTKRYLCIDINVKQNIMYIKIANSFNDKITLKNGELITTKASKSNHGIGLKSVKKIVMEMNGLMEVTWEENIFYVDIMLYINNL